MNRPAYIGDVVPGVDLRGFLSCPYCEGSIQWSGLEVGCSGNVAGLRINGRCACGYVWQAEVMKARIMTGAQRAPLRLDHPGVPFLPNVVNGRDERV